MSEKLKQVNIFPGRFQPFHKGHLKCCEDAYKKNGYPTVIMYVHNTKFDKKKPFDDELLIKELEIIKKEYDYIEDYIPMQRPLLGIMCNDLKEKGYEANIWLAGPDRIDSYKRQLNPKYIDELGVKLPELMETNRYSSATEVREAIKNGDENKFKELMPKGTDKMFDEYKEQLDKVIKENKYLSLSSFIEHEKDKYISLVDYIKESLEDI